MKPSEILRKAAELIDTQHKTRKCFDNPDWDFSKYSNGACYAIDHATEWGNEGNRDIAHKYFAEQMPKRETQSCVWGNPSTCTDEQNAECVAALIRAAEAAENQNE
jgi:hypothetical protein